jgi:thymidylate synthase
MFISVKIVILTENTATMHFEADTIDDLMRQVLTELLKGPFDVNPTRSKGGENPTSEIVGASLTLKNPRARLSLSETRGRLFSVLGEFLWYLSKSNDVEFVKYYINGYEKYNKPNCEGKIDGGYGPRLFNLHGQYDQVKNVIDLLRKNPFSRRAVIQIFDGEDLVKYDEIPCTCTLQFLIRSGKLHLVTYMRSNDAYLGLPHDVFAFTMIQEIIARSLGVDVGYYYHDVGSLHLYYNDKKKVEKYFKEGYQNPDVKFAMPAMPQEDPWSQIETFMTIEANIRLDLDKSLSGLNSYWADLGRLLLIFSLCNNNDTTGIQSLRNEMASSNYDIAIETKLDSFAR